MTPSSNCLDLIETSEGCRLTAYQDSGGVWTIGYGHTKGVYPGQTITQEQAQAFLQEDIQEAVRIVNDNATPCRQGQFDALVDFVFNLGGSKFLSSTLLKYHKAGEYDKAAAEFPKWKYDNGKVEPGLVTRRAKEQSLYTLQEPEAVHPHTDEPEHSDSPTVGSVQPGPVTKNVQPSAVQPAPTSSTAPVSSTPPLGFGFLVLDLVRKLIEALAGKRS